MRMESVFMVFHTSTVKRSTLDESYVDSTVTSIHVLEMPYLPRASLEARSRNGNTLFVYSTLEQNIGE